MNTFFFDDVQYPEGLFGGKDFFNPIIYSTEEREIGVWTDNKPLYQKTLHFQLTSATSYLDLSSLNVENVVFEEGYVVHNNGKYKLDLPYYEDNNYKAFTNYTTDGMNAIAFYVGNGILTYYKNGVITIQYTKTTDVAGSGEYNTLGIPNVHYDGNEKVVGTWFGETLYEKTINTTVTPPYLSIDLSSLNIDEVIGFEGCAKSSGGDSIPFGYSVASGNQYLVASFEKATSTLYISLGSGLSNYNNVFLTIRYTKTS